MQKVIFVYGFDPMSQKRYRSKFRIDADTDPGVLALAARTECLMIMSKACGIVINDYRIVSSKCDIYLLLDAKGYIPIESPFVFNFRKLSEGERASQPVGISLPVYSFSKSVEVA